MRAHRIEITLSEDGVLRLDTLPFQKGETVEVIVLERPSPAAAAELSLKGSVRRFDAPTDPVARDDWEVQQ